MQKITSADIRYNDLANKRFNKRFHGKPEYIQLPASATEVIEAVQGAVNDNKRIVVRSGGHCLEGFVSDPTVQVVIDMSMMNAIYFDEERSAFAVEAGATVGEMYRKLFLGWGVMIPAGEYPEIGVGGHILGGAFGFFCREYGLAADYLYAVAVVHVDVNGKAISTIATREENDPHRELWWAHTGGGGGNFGIVTKYWLRSTDAKGKEPAMALPKAPASVSVFRAAWEWKDLDEAKFAAIVKNYGEWCQKNSAPDSPNARLFSILFLNHRNLGSIGIKGICLGPNAKEIIQDHIDAIQSNSNLNSAVQVEQNTWLQIALKPFPELFNSGLDNVCMKGKDGFFRKPLSEKQVATAYKFLTQEAMIGGGFALATYGGKVNAIPPDATASPQRDAIMSSACNTGWIDPAGEAPSLTWVRNFYKEIFADSGGVPVPNDHTDGCMINHPDPDIADPEWNQSGIPWYTFYYKENYPRLQAVKRQYDPLNIFYHALSIRP